MVLVEEIFEGWSQTCPLMYEPAVPPERIID